MTGLDCGETDHQFLSSSPSSTIATEVELLAGATSSEEEDSSRCSSPLTTPPLSRSSSFIQGTMSPGGTSLVNVCRRCKYAKKRCDRHFPCGRCDRLGFDCQPQDPLSQERPRKLSKLRHHDPARPGLPSPNSALTSAMPISPASIPTDHGAAAPAAPTAISASPTTTSTRPHNTATAIHSPPPPLPPFPPTFAGSTGPLAAARPGGESSCGLLFDHSARDAPQFSQPNATQPLVPRHMSPISLMPCTQTYYHSLGTFSFALSQMEAGETLDKPRLLSMINAWEAYNSRHGMDSTMGRMGPLVHLLGLHSASTCNSGDLHAQQLQQPYTQDPRDGLGRPLPYHIAKLWDPRAAVTIHSFEDGDCHIWCNEHFTQNFMTTGEMMHKLRCFGLNPLLQWATIVSPDDVPAFYEAIATYTCSLPSLRTEMSIVCKCIDKQHRSELSLIRMRYVDIKPNNHHSFVMSILPLPQSHYFCPQPGVPSPPSLSHPQQGTTPSAMPVTASLEDRGEGKQEEGGMSDHDWITAIFSFGEELVMTAEGTLPPASGSVAFGDVSAATTPPSHQAYAPFPPPLTQESSHVSLHSPATTIATSGSTTASAVHGLLPPPAPLSLPSSSFGSVSSVASTITTNSSTHVGYDPSGLLWEDWVPNLSPKTNSEGAGRW